jgi:hypothetical protein
MAQSCLKTEVLEFGRAGIPGMNGIGIAMPELFWEPGRMKNLRRFSGVGP